MPLLFEVQRSAAQALGTRGPHSTPACPTPAPLQRHQTTAMQAWRAVAILALVVSACTADRVLTAVTEAEGKETPA